MKTFPINFNKPQSLQRTNIENNHTDYSQNWLPVLALPKQDTCTFTAKIPRITAPTMEDLINKTKADDVLRFNILRLAEYNIPCPVCGHIMLSVDKYNEFEAKILKTTNTKELLDCIGKLKKYLHPVEMKIFSLFREKHAKNPNITLHEILREMLPVSEPKIVHKQMEIFSNIGLLSRQLPEQKQKNISNLLQETFSRILDPRQTSRFSRRIFIDKLETELLGNNLKPTITDDTAKKIIEEAANLPTAYNNIDAFVVKYAKRNYKDANPNQKIALRMLSNSLATIEHIEPQKMRGETAPDNLALECACDNNRRGHKSILQQIIETPQMIFNYPKYMFRLCEIHLMNKVEKSYISQQNNTFKEASSGILDADLSTIWQTKRKTTPASGGKTPSKNERRTNRKEQQKTKHNPNINKCNTKHKKN